MRWQEMKQLFRKFHLGNSQDGAFNSEERPEDPNSEPSAPETKPLTTISSWFTKLNQSFSGSSQSSPDEEIHSSSKSSEVQAKVDEHSRVTAGTQEAQLLSLSKDLGSSAGNEGEVQAIIHSMDEECQVQLAMALSVCGTQGVDREVAEIAVAKKISLSISTSDQEAEVIAYQYWAHNVVDYDSKVSDGFYDIYSSAYDPRVFGKIPPLVDLQCRPAIGMVDCEVILVNRGADAELLALEKRAIELAVECHRSNPSLIKNGLAKKIAVLVVDKLGGPVESNLDILALWRKSNEGLQSSLGSNVIPLGCLNFGLARHRALLFKILADCVGIPCRLVKGKHYTGVEEGALNLIKDDDESEYAIDLMGAPGAIIPPDVCGVSLSSEATLGQALSSRNDVDPMHSVLDPSDAQHGAFSNATKDLTSALDSQNTQNQASSSAGEGSTTVLSPNVAQNQAPSNTGDDSKAAKPMDASSDKLAQKDNDEINAGGLQSTNVDDIAHVDVNVGELRLGGRYKSEPTELEGLSDIPARPSAPRFGHSHSHLRSPSWTEGIGSPAARELKAKDVSLYMLDAAKENPGLAQKLQNVLLESGVVAPPELFSDISPKQLQAQVKEDRATEATPEIVKEKKPDQVPKGRNKGKPPPAITKYSSPASEEAFQDRLPRLQSVEGLGERRPLEPTPASLAALSPAAASAAVSYPTPAPTVPATSAATASILAAVQESLPQELLKHVPVAAASAITAAVVASSMVVAAVKSEIGQDPKLEVPITAAATATAAIVAATSAAVGLKIESSENNPSGRLENEGSGKNMVVEANRYEDINKASSSDSSIPEGGHDSEVGSGEQNLDLSRPRSRNYAEILHDDIAEFEIAWDEVVIGDRIGIGSYGEVYRGEWHGTEVAVKKFLDQDISGDALEEFRSEVRLMKRMRHPNVVLFMGAVTRSPNLSIVTEFLPRGSLYRLMHRSSNLLDERRRLRMALDVAKGMNYLHTCTPMIVHRDLKSPNLLVDKNWVVKVCDFGLSRMKHHTYLSSKSTAGTPEWMAPEVLRNEPSNEKADVYSFGVILWELATLEQPWNGMNPMQVVGAVGFQNRRLDIPEDMDPNLAKIIVDCFHNDSQGRPSFAQIMSSLKPLQRPITASQPHTSKPGVITALSQVKPPPLQDNSSPQANMKMTSGACNGKDAREDSHED